MASGATTVQYSEAFKLQVVSELESGKLRSISEANRTYGIPGATTVKGWLRKYGRGHLMPRTIRVETPNEKDRIRALKKENDRLKKALADSHVKAVLYEAWFEVACEEFGVTDVDGFKKNSKNGNRLVPEPRNNGSARKGFVRTCWLHAAGILQAREGA